MMKKSILALLLFFIGAIIYLMPNFYRNKWRIIESDNYEYWQAIFDRTVIARLVKTRQDGFLSAGGLLGLGDTDEWSSLNSVIMHQYDVYTSGGKFETYNVYTSTPGFPGFIFGIIDRLTNFPENSKLKIFRAGEAFASAAVMALIFAWLIKEFGWLAGILPLLFTGFSDALIRPAGSIFWNLWVFYLPMIVCTILLANGSKRRIYPATQLLWALYFLSVFKIMMNGFEGITTFIVMTTVPFVYFGILDKWSWKVFLERMVRLGIVLSFAIITGLTILSIQIMISKGSFSDSIHYIWDAFNRRAIGDPARYGGTLAESMSASISEVIWKYLILDIIDIRISQQTWHITYLQVFIAFFLFTLILFSRHSREKESNSKRKNWSLAIATWYSILAPLSWFIVFKPNAYLHATIYAMLWHMPFTLLGFALCGLVVTDLFRRKAV